ncbi:CLAVATA3/ESR (CLE)-related protein 46 [Cornus florida]|uniref:CLAVATA3/ESR (CLE)-related protein 46 n=1 Tax=Cornus florida TaxID=4283 RepID=UPI00289D3AC5|nr:CLAVATA3/ESR (CLE)-related protein 46 [Cornus florida]
MRRGSQRLIHLLLVWFLLAALQNRCSITFEVQATESVDFKLRPAQLSSRSTSAYILTTWVEEGKNHKASSVPNPVGNHRPPSRG